MNKLVFKNDAYKKARGDFSHFLTLYCEHCRTPLPLYQKDGAGPLKRLYLDRIIAPKNLVGLQEEEKIDNLVCPECKRLIAVPHVYEEEKRKIYALLSFSFIEKETEGIFDTKK